jgi:prophage antirepressor-like protein
MPNLSKIQASFSFHPFIYGDIKIRETAIINGTPYFTRRAIGEWLEYKRPQESVDRLIQRNPHISNPEWATHVNLTCVEGNRSVVRAIETYSPIGLQLIVFESRQPKAIEYKIAVAKLVNDIMTGKFWWNIIFPPKKSKKAFIN